MIKSKDFLKVFLLIIIPLLFFLHALYQLTPKTSIAMNINKIVQQNNVSTNSK